MTDIPGPQTPGPPPGGLAEERLLTEDVLLLLFQPASGSIAGENTLYYVLGGAALGDLALMGRVEVAKATLLSTKVQTVGKGEPSDPLLDSAWNYLEKKPRDVQTVLAAVGPPLRAQVIDRLVERGDLNRKKAKMLGIFPSSKLSLGSARREELITQVRAALLDGQTPSPRIAASIALLSASGTLPQFHKEIPWSGQVYHRAKEIERGDWGASATAEAVARTMAAIVSNSLFVGSVLRSE
ncbi:GOLPH3/VPS74 family protein [Galactobacter caseinivorans]|uniref:GPP34 family phosphoprotein n=1 Tax=Galactobacter caseinivorans TaxID=2676123 RepID=A0A496PIC1_9MICC|nr:GPP34 family phosphoprotein [Galactobacter caseinivorans]RKW70227.1 GPP34 family phosphoprotein [Galactobacter caseinivorans]